MRREECVFDECLRACLDGWMVGCISLCMLTSIRPVQLLPAGTECRVAVVDRLVGTTHRLLQQRHRIAQVLFDLAHVHVASVLFADQAYLSCLGSSRRCALIVHVGDSYTQVVPVIRGSDDEEMPEPLLSCARTSELAGDTITRLLGVALKEQAAAFKAVTNEPYGGSKTQLLLRAIKDECCWVSIDYQQDLQSCAQSTALEQVRVWSRACLLSGMSGQQPSLLCCVTTRSLRRVVDLSHA